MPLQAPLLDDRRFADLVAQARTLIPRYAPEWTDFNESDPGITLLQLFAWMTDILIYRLNQVPELNYIKFLQLLGIELRPAEPARADLTFKLVENSTLDSVIVPKGTQVAASGSGSDGPVVFETDMPLIALKAQLKAVQSFDGLSYTVNTAKNGQQGQWYQPFGPYAREGSYLMLGFDSQQAFTEEQVNLMVYVYTEHLKAEGQHCDLDTTIVPTQVTLAWEYWDGREWAELVLDKDETRAFTHNGHVYLRGPGSNAKKDLLGRVNDNPYYWIRARLVTGRYEIAPRLAAVLINTVGASQVTTIRQERLGTSNGRPNQVFRVSQTPIVVRDTPLSLSEAGGENVTVSSLWLQVDEGDGLHSWQEVSDFYASKPDDRHYVLNRTTGEILFGDGQRGRIPLASNRIIAQDYSYGGGKQGNAGANTITGLQTFVDAVDSVTNLRAAEGGSDEETVEDAKKRAPLELQSKGRAVTAEDFELLAIETPSARVRRAKALPLTHPKFPDQPIPGVVTVIVVPDSDLPNPTPSPSTLELVCSHLNKYRLLTCEVYIVPPTYRKVRIEADIIAAPEADLAEVKKGVEDSLRQYFHPLIGGDDGQGWAFGQDIFYSRLYRIILEVPGVDRINDNQLVIMLDNRQKPFCRDVPIGKGSLLYSDEHAINVTYSF